MGRAFFPLVLLLTACSSAAQQTEEQYRIVSDGGGSAQEKCTVAGRVADAWLKERNEAKYQEWRLTRDINCQTADLSRYR